MGSTGLPSTIQSSHVLNHRADSDDMNLNPSPTRSAKSQVTDHSHPGTHPSSDTLALGSDDFRHSPSPMPLKTPTTASGSCIVVDLPRRNDQDEGRDHETQRQRIGSGYRRQSSGSSPEDVQSAHMPRPRRNRQRLVVEIPLLPLSTLYTYAHQAGAAVPNAKSRARLLVASSDRSDSLALESLSSPSSSAGPSRDKMNRGWKVRSSPSDPLAEVNGETNVFNERSPSVGFSDETGSFTDDSDSDPIALRRSDRAGAKEAGRRSEGKISSRTRAKRPAKMSRSSPISFSDSGSSVIAYAHPVRSSTYAKDNARNRGLPISSSSSYGRKQSFSDSDDDFDMIGEEEDRLEASDESDYGRTRGGNSKGKGRTSKRIAETDVHEDVVYNHRPFCEKCSREPADDILANALAKKSRGKKKRKRDEDRISDDELADSLEGWLECKTCCVSSHWGCLLPQQKKDVLLELASQEGPPAPGQKLRRSLKIDESFDFTCAKCAVSASCFVCQDQGYSAGKGEREHKDHGKSVVPTNDEDDHYDSKPEEKAGEDEKPPLFRCLRCRQSVHYEHLEIPRSLGDRPQLKDIAYHYQNSSKGGQAWFCHLCRSWIWTVDIIIAWRPSPADIQEPELDEDEKANWKDPLPREYLVKWTSRGFRHVTWVPHAWLQVTTAGKLRHFLEHGPALDLVTDETLAARGDEMAQPTIAALTAEEDKSASTKRHTHGPTEDIKKEWKGIGPGPEAEAEASLPVEWSTVDRVLDIMLLPPAKKVAALSQKNVQRRGQRIMSESGSESSGQSQQDRENGRSSPADEMRIRLGLKDGQQPPSDMLMAIDEYEQSARRVLNADDVDEVAGLITWCFVKWDDLQYDQSTWDTPPPATSSLYPAFKRALARFLQARRVDIPVLSPAQARERDLNAEKAYVPPKEQPDCVVGGTLMPFQMEGFQWLLYKHFRRESCILADDMGLGKTVQIASVLGYLGSSKLHVYPCLVVVPNSTITNWVREFEKWVPHMRVVPYYGEAASRKIISKYELYHQGMQGKAAGLKAHIVLTTYDMITGSEFRVFSGIPRWEVLCIDEGQRLKSDSNLIFNRLKTLKTVHRILLTGTPLNNNLRELFNLLNFLDPATFSDLHELEARFADLNEALVQELHEIIKPYILRRIKADVLKLPPKIEIIVPISLSPIQKQVYKSVFERNAELIQAIIQARKKRLKGFTASRA
ncbi:hypothetical protein IAU60_003489 [Kwoniella sp. DSM 27419]